MNIHSSDNLDYIIEKLEDVYQEVTGKSLRKQHVIESDEFLKQAGFINEKILEYRKAQKLRDDLVDGKGHEEGVGRIKATNKLKGMRQDIQKNIELLKETLTRQGKSKGQGGEKEFKVSLSSKKDTLKHLQKIMKNLEEGEYLVNEVGKDESKKNKGKNLRFGEYLI
jgi:hypothetical protein